MSVPTEPRWNRVIGRRRMLGLLAAGAASALTGCQWSKPPEFTGVGKITFAVPPDFSLGGQRKLSVDHWNDGNHGQKVEFIELPTAADGQHSQLVAKLQAESNEYDVIGLDVTWTAQFAREGYILPLTSVGKRLGIERFLPAALETGRFQRELWAVPLHTNVGVLYYRTDLVKLPPGDWAGLRQQARRLVLEAGIDGLVGQFDHYEGLTVNVSEAVWGHKGALVEGNRVTVDRPEAVDGLDFLTTALREGWIPREALAYDEERSRRRFQDGKAAFLRNWPYAYALLDQEDSRVRGSFGVAPLPGPNALGGANLAITKSCANRETALRFIEFLTSDKVQQAAFAAGGQQPSITSVYTRPNVEDPRIRRMRPFIETLHKGNQAARPRPVTPYYQQVSNVIQDAVHPALQELHDAGDTMRALADRLEEALRGR
jgi:multiple sugar transport system substrate-binding protein